MLDLRGFLQGYLEEDIGRKTKAANVFQAFIAQRIMSNAQESKLEIPLDMGETVSQDGTGVPHHSDSDSSVPFHREDLEQSRDDLEGDMDSSQKHIRRDMTEEGIR